MMDFMSPGTRSLDFGKAVEFIVDFDRLFPASIGCVSRGFRDMPLSEQIDYVFRFGFPVLACLSFGTSARPRSHVLLLFFRTRAARRIVAAHEALESGYEVHSFSPMTTGFVPFVYLAAMGLACVGLDRLVEARFARAPPPDAKVSSDSNRWAAVVSAQAAGGES